MLKGMIADKNSGTDAPLTWVGTFPIYVSTVLAAAHSLAMVLLVFAAAAGAEGLTQSLDFSSADILSHFAIWQCVTYAFVHQPSLWFVLEMYLLVVFGREIEKYLGRRAFVELYLTLLLLPPVALTAAGVFGVSSILMGSSALHFGVFVAFAALYPRAEIFFSIQARWVAGVLFVINALQCLSKNDLVGLSVLVLVTGAAVFLVSRMRGVGDFSIAETAKSILPKLKLRDVKPVQNVGSVHESIDPILDKISRTGLASLSPQEKQRLENAREQLLAKEKSL